MEPIMRNPKDALLDSWHHNAQAWIDAALKRGSKDPQLVFLAGGLAFAQGDNAKAIRYWEQVLKSFPLGSDEAKFVQQNIDEARARQK